MNEDVVRLVPTRLGGTTAGTWSLYYDGSAAGFSDNLTALEHRE